jgi:hypothetical protein
MAVGGRGSWEQRCKLHVAAGRGRRRHRRRSATTGRAVSNTPPQRRSTSSLVVTAGCAAHACKMGRTATSRMCRKLPEVWMHHVVADSHRRLTSATEASHCNRLNAHRCYLGTAKILDPFFDSFLECFHLAEPFLCCS